MLTTRHPISADWSGPGSGDGPGWSACATCVPEAIAAVFGQQVSGDRAGAAGRL